MAASTGVGNISATVGSANSPANSPAFLKAAQTVYGDLNSGNYTGAWNTALGTSSMFGTNMNSVTTDPLLQALESSQGLKAFDPNKQWTPQDLNAYYQAFNSTGAYHGNNAGGEYLGQNPYGLWGSASGITSGSDMQANLSQEGTTPDVGRFVGARPSKSFLGKYGTDIAALGLMAAAPYAIGAMAPELSAGAAIASGGATGAATGLIGSVGAGALYGAGSGALLGALGGGNIGKDALLGGLGGGIMSGANTLGSYYGVPGGLSTAAGKYATGMVDGAVGGGSAQTGVWRGPVNGQNPPSWGNAAGGQGYNNGMGSTDTTLAGTIIGALPGTLQGAAGVYGSQNAAEKLTQADQNAIGTQTSTLGNINSIWQPQRDLGVGADKALGAALGTNGQPADYSGFENMPGYQFAVKQGTQALQRQAAAIGNAYTPNTAAAIGQYVTGTAMQDYNTYISQLMGAAGLGSTANTGVANPTYQTGANISTLQQNQGYAQASGVQGAANAVGGWLSPAGAGSSLIGAAANWLRGGGSGNSGGYSGGGYGNGGGGSYNTDFMNYNASNGYTGGGDGSFGSGVNDNTGASWLDGSQPISTNIDVGNLGDSIGNLTFG